MGVILQLLEVAWRLGCCEYSPPVNGVATHLILERTSTHILGRKNLGMLFKKLSFQLHHYISNNFTVSAIS